MLPFAVMTAMHPNIGFSIKAFDRRLAAIGMSICIVAMIAGLLGMLSLILAATGLIDPVLAAAITKSLFLFGAIVGFVFGGLGVVVVWATESARGLSYLRISEVTVKLSANGNIHSQDSNVPLPPPRP